MKASKTLIESVSDIEQVTTQGELRRIVANSLLALVRKEISSTDLEAIAKGLDSISNSLNAEVKVAKTAMELREKGGDLGRVSHLGSMLIGTAPPRELEPTKPTALGSSGAPNSQTPKTQAAAA